MPTKKAISRNHAPRAAAYAAHSGMASGYRLSALAFPWCDGRWVETGRNEPDCRMWRTKLADGDDVTRLARWRRTFQATDFSMLITTFDKSARTPTDPCSAVGAASAWFYGESLFVVSVTSTVLGVKQISAAAPRGRFTTSESAHTNRAVPGYSRSLSMRVGNRFRSLALPQWGLR